jgi:hypothetical protein
MAVCWRPGQPSNHKPPNTKLPSSSHPSRSSVMGSGHLAVVTDQLKSTDHLADGEEAEALGKQNATSNSLRPVDVSHPLEDGAGRRTSLLGGLEQGAGVSHLLPEVGEVALEGGNGPAQRGRLLVNKACQSDTPVPTGTYGGVMFWPLKTILESSMPTLE